MKAFIKVFLDLICNFEDHVLAVLNRLNRNLDRLNNPRKYIEEEMRCVWCGLIPGDYYHPHNCCPFEREF